MKQEKKGQAKKQPAVKPVKTVEELYRRMEKPGGRMTPAFRDGKKVN